MVIMEPVQNAGGSFTPPAGYFEGVRAICDRYGILLCADEVITAFGRLGDWFGSARYDIRPDLITCAKGLSSAYAPIGAVLAADRLIEPFLEGRRRSRTGSRSAAIRAGRGRAEEHRDHEARADRRARARARGAFRDALAQLLELPIVGDLRGTGYFWALELVKDKETRATSTTPSARRCCAASSRAACSSAA